MAASVVFSALAKNLFARRAAGLALDQFGRDRRSGPRFLHQLFFAPSKIQARMASRSQVESFFLPCGMRNSGEARQSSSHIKLLLCASPGITMGPSLVPFITPS